MDVAVAIHHRSGIVGPPHPGRSDGVDIVADDALDMRVHPLAPLEQLGQLPNGHGFTVVQKDIVPKMRSKLRTLNKFAHQPEALAEPPGVLSFGGKVQSDDRLNLCIC